MLNEVNRLIGGNQPISKKCLSGAILKVISATGQVEKTIKLESLDDLETEIKNDKDCKKILEVDINSLSASSAMFIWGSPDDSKI